MPPGGMMKLPPPLWLLAPSGPAAAWMSLASNKAATVCGGISTLPMKIVRPWIAPLGMTMTEPSGCTNSRFSPLTRGESMLAPSGSRTIEPSSTSITRLAGRTLPAAGVAPVAAWAMTKAG